MTNEMFSISAILTTAIVMTIFALSRKKEDTFQEALGRAGDEMLNEYIRSQIRNKWLKMFLGSLVLSGATFTGVQLMANSNPVIFGGPDGKSGIFDIFSQQGRPATANRPIGAGSNSDVTVLFQCDWDDLGDRAEVQSCGAGSSYSWDINGTTNDTAVQVVDATDNGLSVNWPNDRAYLVRCQDRGANGCARNVVRTDSVFALPVAGDTLSFRFSRAVSSDVMKGTGDMSEHGFKWSVSGALSSTQASNHMYLDVSASTWYTAAEMQQGQPAINSKWCPMAAGDTGGCNQGPGEYQFADDYGYELVYLYSFPTDTSYILEDIRVYDIPGDSLISGITWQNTNGSDSLPSPEFVVDTTSARGWNWHTITLGHSANGEFSFEGVGERLFYFGGFAVCKQDWCPRYGGLAGES